MSGYEPRDTSAKVSVVIMLILTIATWYQTLVSAWGIASAQVSAAGATTITNDPPSSISPSQEMTHTVYLPALMNNACAGAPRFWCRPQPQDTTGEVDFGSTAVVSPDGEVTTIFFSDLVTALDSSTDLVSARLASFVLPVQSNTDLLVQLNVWGFVDRAPGTRATLIIHHAGETRLVHLPEDPAADFEQNLTTLLPAGHDYSVTLMLLVERNSTRPDTGGIAVIDGLEVVLEPFADAVDPEFGFTSEPRLQNTISEASFGSALSDDGYVATLVFDNLVTSLDSSTEDLVSAGLASFVFPVQSSTDLPVRLHVEGFVDRAAGTRGMLIISHPGGTSLVHLPADPAAGFVRNLGTTIPAGQDLPVTVFLLAERDMAGPGSDILFGIDTIEAVLE